MKAELEEMLEHSGVKGMHWGSRKNASINTESKKEHSPGKIKQHINSIKREHQWKKTLKNLDNMSTKDVNKIANRIQLENDLKRLSRNKKLKNPIAPTVATKKDRIDYLNRGLMSDQELARKVIRLRAKDNLLRTTRDATKTQRELGKRVVTTAATVGVKYALTGKISKGDIAAAALMHPNAATSKLKQDITKNVLDGKKNKQNKA